MLSKRNKIYVAGHTGMVGSALLRRLQRAGYANLVTRTRRELNLLDQAAVLDFMLTERPAYLFLAAAKVGGIHANNVRRADFIWQNLMIEANLIHAAYSAGVGRLMFLGSSCIYPRDCAQPIREEYLLTGALEPTNEPYAVAKIAGVKLCESFNRQYGTRYLCAMPTNLYGPRDNFDLDTSHVIPALLRKFHEARVNGAANVTVWGTGSPRREFLHVDDLADACVFLMERGIDEALINVGAGEDIRIGELAELMREITGFEGELVFDRGRPDGTPRKLLDVSKLQALGWTPRYSLREGLERTYAWYRQQVDRPCRALAS